jgi:hypothetical protein
MKPKHLAFLALLIAALAWPAWAEEECGAPTGDPVAIKKLTVEINVLNLLNGLHLSVAQVQALLDGARKVKALRETHIGPSETTVAPEQAAALCKALEAVRTFYEKGKTPSPEAAARLKTALKKASAGRKPARRGNQQAYRREVRLVEESVCAQLSDAQLEVIAEFDPCLIPPRNLRDPVRVGQAKSFGRQEKMLQNLRKIPGERWQKLGRLILEKALGMWEKRHGAMKADVRAREIDRAAGIIEQAREMSEVDFQIHKAEMAERITFLDMKEELKKEIQGLVKRRFAPPGKVAHILLDPRIIDVLARRWELMRHWERDPAVDLDRIRPANTCKDGKCGTKVKTPK